MSPIQPLVRQKQRLRENTKLQLASKTRRFFPDRSYYGSCYVEYPYDKYKYGVERLLNIYFGVFLHFKFISRNKYDDLMPFNFYPNPVMNVVWGM